MTDCFVFFVFFLHPAPPKKKNLYLHYISKSISVQLIVISVCCSGEEGRNVVRPRSGVLMQGYVQRTLESVLDCERFWECATDETGLPLTKQRGREGGKKKPLCNTKRQHQGISLRCGCQNRTPTSTPGACT